MKPEWKERATELAKQLNVDASGDATCEELQNVLESLWAALEDAPTPHKAGILKQINKVLKEMEQKGC